MTSQDVQTVSNQEGEPTAVLVPIELWREIESERETAYLLESPTMKERILRGVSQHSGIPFEDGMLSEFEVELSA